jgi:hypothetical protein
MKQQYETVIKLMCEYNAALVDAMVLSQSWVFEGHKRKYRIANRKVTHWKKHVMNEMIDDHQIIPTVEHVAHRSYVVGNMEEHSKRWMDYIAGLTAKVAQLNVAIQQAAGRTSCSVSSFLDHLYHEKQKSWRWYHDMMQIEEPSARLHDMKMKDRVLHDKLKKKERKYGS